VAVLNGTLFRHNYEMTHMVSQFYLLYVKEFKALEIIVQTRFCVNCRMERTWPVVTDEWSWPVLVRILHFVRLVVSDEWNNKAIGRENRPLYSLMFFPYIFPHLSTDVEQWVCNINDRLVCVLCNAVSSFFYSLNRHRNTHISERPTRCTLFLNNLFQLNYPRHVSNK